MNYYPKLGNNIPADVAYGRLNVHRAATILGFNESDYANLSEPELDKTIGKRPANINAQSGSISGSGDERSFDNVKSPNSRYIDTGETDIEMGFEWFVFKKRSQKFRKLTAKQRGHTEPYIIPSAMVRNPKIPEMNPP